MTTGQRDSRTAVDKALALLRAFGDEVTSGVGVSELARRTELSKSTAFRLLGILERNGAVERAGSNYRLGPMIHDLPTPESAPEIDMLRDVLTPFLSILYEQSRQTVHLAVLQGTDVVYLNKLHGFHRVPSPSRIGGRVPAYCTGIGKAMLAYDPVLIDQVCSSELPAITPHTITDPDKLRRQLARVKEQGIAFDFEEVRRGLNCVAAPVMSPTHTPVAGLSISGPVGKFDPRRWATPLRQISFEASKVYAAQLRARRQRAATTVKTA